MFRNHFNHSHALSSLRLYGLWSMHAGECVHVNLGRDVLIRLFVRLFVVHIGRIFTSRSQVPIDRTLMAPAVAAAAAVSAASDYCEVTLGTGKSLDKHR